MTDKGTIVLLNNHCTTPTKLLASTLLTWAWLLFCIAAVEKIHQHCRGWWEC
jgi:hypothetical protein